MGGNLFKQYGGRRFLRAEYEALRTEVLTKLHEFSRHRYGWREIPYVLDKVSFGDLDIVHDPIHSDDWRKHVLDVFKAEHYHINGPYFSFLYKEIQVDLIDAGYNGVNVAIDYYSYNDLGNLLGKQFHALGFKYGHNGLYYILKDGTRKISDVYVSTNTTDIHNFLGLDVGKFRSGFKTLEEMYDFVISSEYFNPDIYRYENLNNQNRIRDRKRSSYHGFLQYIGIAPNEDGTVISRIPKDKRFFLYRDHSPQDKIRLVDRFFGNIQSDIEEKLEIDARDRARKEKLSGKLVMEWLDYRLEGKHLGEFMHHLKHYSTSSEIVDLDNYSIYDVKAAVIDEYDRWILV